MISIILAGGYATRLWPLTKDIPKPLLPVGKKCIMDYIIEKLINIDQINRIIILTNLRFKSDFERWAQKYQEAPLDIICDKSYKEEEKPGAVKALSDLVSNLHDDCLVIAGDNLFTDDLKGFIEEYEKHGTTMMGLYDVGDVSLARNYAVVRVDQDMQVLSIREKPDNPETTLVSTGIYLFPSSVLPRFREYVVGGSNLDEPGKFMEWLLKSEPIYGYILSGEWYDIGTPETYKMALEKFASKI